jgi:hypothetical protein
MSAASAALLLFATCNALRILAYVFQIARIVRDERGSGTVCYATWTLFAASNVSTVFYAVAVASDWVLAMVFTVNAACCVAIIALSRMNHLLKGSSYAVETSRSQESVLRSGYSQAATSTDPAANRVGVG